MRLGRNQGLSDKSGWTGDRFPLKRLLNLSKVVSIDGGNGGGTGAEDDGKGEEGDATEDEG